MNSTIAMRRRLSALEQSRGLAAPALLTGDDRHWAVLHLPEFFFGERWESLGKRAVSVFASARGLQPTQIVVVGCRGVAEFARRVYREKHSPAESEAMLCEFLAGIELDFVDAGLTPDAVGEGLRELSDLSIRSNSRKAVIDFGAMQRVQRELLGLPQLEEQP